MRVPPLDTGHEDEEREHREANERAESGLLAVARVVGGVRLGLERYIVYSSRREESKESPGFL